MFLDSYLGSTGDGGKILVNIMVQIATSNLEFFEQDFSECNKDMSNSLNNSSLKE